MNESSRRTKHRAASLWQLSFFFSPIVVSTVQILINWWRLLLVWRGRRWFTNLEVRYSCIVSLWSANIFSSLIDCAVAPVNLTRYDVWYWLSDGKWNANANWIDTYRTTISIAICSKTLFPRIIIGSHCQQQQPWREACNQVVYGPTADTICGRSGSFKRVLDISPSHTYTYSRPGQFPSPPMTAVKAKNLKNGT